MDTLVGNAWFGADTKDIIDKLLKTYNLKNFRENNIKEKKKGKRFTENIVGLLFSKRSMMKHFYIYSLGSKTVTIKKIF